METEKLDGGNKHFKAVNAFRRTQVCSCRKIKSVSPETPQTPLFSALFTQNPTIKKTEVRDFD